MGLHDTLFKAIRLLQLAASAALFPTGDGRSLRAELRDLSIDQDAVLVRHNLSKQEAAADWILRFMSAELRDLSTDQDAVLVRHNLSEQEAAAHWTFMKRSPTPSRPAATRAW